MVEVSKSPTSEQNNNNDVRCHIGDACAAKVISVKDKVMNTSRNLDSDDHDQGRVNTADATESNFIPIFDINYSGIEDNFVNSILHVHQFGKNSIRNVHTLIHKNWREQFEFGFVPIDEQKMPDTLTVNGCTDISPFELHSRVRALGLPNFMGVRIPVKSQLNIHAWRENLSQYWDQQLLQLLEFGFPLDFNRKCPLACEMGNHKSATEFPADIDAYIDKETKFDAILGPFKEKPIALSHSSPFMTRPKPNSDRRHVIIDLSWSLGASVNASIYKNSYLDSDFSLTFPTVDDITAELKTLGRGALLYKVDVSHAFRHVKVDPVDFDLLGLEWNGHYVDMCVPFGTRHGSQIFQRLNDGVRYIMHQKGFIIIDYIDDYIGMAFSALHQPLMLSLLTSWDIWD